MENFDITEKEGFHLIEEGKVGTLTVHRHFPADKRLFVRGFLWGLGFWVALVCTIGVVQTVAKLWAQL